MRETEERERTRTETITTAIRCGCGQAVDKIKLSGSEEVDWSTENYDFDEIIVRRQVGVRYPEFMDMKTTFYDLCPSCWLKVASFIERELGGKAEIRDYSD